MSIFRVALLLSCLLFGSGMWVPSLSAARVQPNPAAAQPNLVVRRLGAIGGQITGITSSGTLIYLAQASGLTILNAADPLRIAMLSRRAVANTQVRSVQLVGDLAYLTTDQSIALVSVADPTAPVIRASIPTVGSIEAMTIQGNTMYLSISNTLQLFDLSSPARPLYRGSFPLRGYPTDIVIVKNLAYITCGHCEPKPASHPWAIAWSRSRNIRRSRATQCGDRPRCAGHESCEPRHPDAAWQLCDADGIPQRSPDLRRHRLPRRSVYRYSDS